PTVISTPIIIEKSWISLAVVPERVTTPESIRRRKSRIHLNEALVSVWRNSGDHVICSFKFFVRLCFVSEFAARNRHHFKRSYEHRFFVIKVLV
ncbi:hypothetical protein C0J52_26902, partial [Blattella germanica]